MSRLDDYFNDQWSMIYIFDAERKIWSIDEFIWERVYDRWLNTILKLIFDINFWNVSFNILKTNKYPILWCIDLHQLIKNSSYTWHDFIEFQNFRLFKFENIYMFSMKTFIIFFLRLHHVKAWYKFPQK
jgi:hypothetical protein